MTLIKISNNQLKFERPIVLNPEKKNKLGITNLMFSFDKHFEVKDFSLEIHIQIPDSTSYFIVKTIIEGNFTIDSFKKFFQQVFDDAYNALIEKIKKKNLISIINLKN
jgi:hypothetical protein